MVIYVNKVLIIVYVPFIEEQYELFIPINKKVGTIKKTLMESIVELSNGEITSDANLKLYDKNTGVPIRSDIYVKDSTIRNGSKLVLM